MQPYQDQWQRAGYPDRLSYLESLKREYGIPMWKVLQLANLLGPTEDFDALVAYCQDIADELSPVVRPSSD